MKQNLDDMMLDNEQYAQLKRQQFKQKQLNKQIKQNQKSYLGFGYTYKEINHDS